MTSTNLQNGNPESDNLSSTPINQKNSINLRQTPQQQPSLPQHNLFNGNNKIPSQRVISGTPTPTAGNGEPNFEGLVMNRKITLNGGNELRIDDKNISLHLNNPFVTNYVSQQHYAEVGRSGPINPSNNVIRNPNFKGSENNLDECGILYGDGRNRPKRPHSIAVSSPLNNRQNNDLSTIYSHKMNVQPGRDVDKEPIYAHMYNQFKNSPSRLQSRSTHEFSLYQPPSPIANLQLQQQQQQALQMSPAGVVQRRSHSTPRPIQNFPQQQQQQSQLINGQPTVIAQRPRSLDRCNGTQTMDKNYKPPIPSRRMPQSGINQNPMLTPTSRQLQPSSSSGGMRQSATFHGQLNRQAANYSFPHDSTNMNNDIIGTENGTRRKSDRPMSYAYGTLPDQVFLENQLRIYSEQLKSITESVRKYSEQAKLLSEMKRQQQLQKHPLQMSQQNGNNNVPIMKNDSKPYQTSGGDISADEPQTPSHQLKLFLDNIRSSMNNPSENCDVVDKVPERSSGDADVQSAYRSTKTKDDSPGYVRAELKTPSDQLRHFLDAIRSNQVTEEDDIKGACDRFNKFKEKIESGRPKSVNMDKFRQSSSANESFSQISDNLRIMNEDLEALAAKSPSKLKFNQQTKSEKPVLDFNQILDHFQRVNGNSHSAETMDYLRKCSESLKHSSEQLRISTMNNNNGFSDSPESSSCSTTPGSIREAVQNLLMQPRNGFQIMDDRMKLFIDILDSQEKFSQV